MAPARETQKKKPCKGTPRTPPRSVFKKGMFKGGFTFGSKKDKQHIFLVSNQVCNYSVN